MNKITIQDIEEYHKKIDNAKTIGEFKTIGRELRNKFNLTDLEAIDILNKRYDKIFKILSKYEK